MKNAFNLLHSIANLVSSVVTIVGAVLLYEKMSFDSLPGQKAAFVFVASAAILAIAIYIFQFSLAVYFINRWPRLDGDMVNFDFVEKNTSSFSEFVSTLLGIIWAAAGLTYCHAVILGWLVGLVIGGFFWLAVGQVIHKAMMSTLKMYFAGG